jgi:gamma-glutamyl hydrolase
MTSDGYPLEAIDHSADAVLIAQYMANFFVGETRQNYHRFPTQTDEDNELIYNYQPTKTSGSFVQEYFFPNNF